MLLGLDLGTTNVKAIVTDRDGRLVAQGSAPVGLIHVGADGVEQDIEEIWQATLAAISQAGECCGLAAVEAVGISAQGGAMQLLDGDGQPVGRVISWLDGRGRPHDTAITRELGSDWFAQHTGHGSSGISIGEILRLREECPALLRRPNRIGYVGDVIVARLCGRGAHDATSLSIAMLYNPSLRTMDPDLLARLGLGAEQLPALLSPRQAAGPLRDGLAAATGLRRGIPVSAAIHDQYAAALGGGAVGPGDVSFGAGTAWVFLAAVERLTGPVIPAAFACTHVAEGLYGQMLSLGNGGSSLTWALDLVGLGDARGEAIDATMGNVAAGSDGLRFWPFLAAANPAGLVPGTPGRLDGLKLSHTAAHVVRAVVEGLALELTRYLRFLTDAGLAVGRLVMSGGAAASRVTPQIIADATGLPLVCTTESAMSALGAAVVARGLVEPDAALADLAGAMAPPTRGVEPGPNADCYQRLFEDYVVSLPVQGD